MFWGSIIKENQPLKSQKILETSEFAVLHLSAAVLASSDNKKTMLFAKQGKDAEVCIAVLSADNEMAKLDLYINCTQSVTILAKGQGEVHLSGYFEPKESDMDDDMFYGQEKDVDTEKDSDEDEDTAKDSKKSLKTSLNQAKVNSNKNANAITAAAAKDLALLAKDDDSEREIEDDMEDLDDEDEEDEIDLKKEDSDSDSDEVAVPVKKS